MIIYQMMNIEPLFTFDYSLLTIVLFGWIHSPVFTLN